MKKNNKTEKTLPTICNAILLEECLIQWIATHQVALVAKCKYCSVTLALVTHYFMLNVAQK